MKEKKDFFVEIFDLGVFRDNYYYLLLKNQ